jgi:fatty acid desaturase
MVTVHTDRDLEVQLPWLATTLMWIGYWTFDWSLLATNMGRILRHSFGHLSEEWEYRLFPESEAKLRRKLFNWARFVLIGHLTLATVFIISGHWFLLILVTLGAFAFWGTAPAWLVTYTQHAGLPSDVPDFRLCCRSVNSPAWLRFLHWQMDYHIEHHMFAAVPFYNLKKLRALIEDDLPDYEPLLKTWSRMVPTLRRQRSEPGYCVIPVLPDAKNK